MYFIHLNYFNQIYLNTILFDFLIQCLLYFYLNQVLSNAFIHLDQILFILIKRCFYLNKIILF